MVNGICMACPNGLVYDPTTGTCLAVFHSKGQNTDQISVCKANEVVVDGKCVCDERSVRSNGHCYPCPPTTFKSISLCLPCPNYCLKCTSQSSCDVCRKGFDRKGVNCI